MKSDRQRLVREKVAAASAAGLDWVSFTARVTEVLRSEIGFDRCCWHTVDPGTVLFTGSVNQGVTCSGTWLAAHEYVIDDVNKWWFLARSGHLAGATSLATHGDLSRSARHRSQVGFGIGDELRAAFVADGIYWGAAGFLRDDDQPWFTEADVRFLASLSAPIAEGLRRAHVASDRIVETIAVVDGPGVIVFDPAGHPEMTSPAAELWISQLVEEPAPESSSESKIVQSVVARTRALGADGDPVHFAARARAQTRSGAWLLLYGTPLAGNPPGRIAVVIQPAAPSEVAPLVALAYGLTGRERDIVRACTQGRTTKEIAAAFHIAPYTVQDHLKSIFDKTGVRTRNELVGRIFVEHYCTRWEEVVDRPQEWPVALATSAVNPGRGTREPFGSS